MIVFFFQVWPSELVPMDELYQWTHYLFSLWIRAFVGWITLNSPVETQIDSIVIFPRIISYWNILNLLLNNFPKVVSQGLPLDLYSDLGRTTFGSYPMLICHLGIRAAHYSTISGDEWWTNICQLFQGEQTGMKFLTHGHVGISTIVHIRGISSNNYL